ncbi:MAG: tRNA (guanosine(37)-N1)-methyltransferase TrmD [Candidatus Woykebacteria bacterium GWB1_45_5]|uniref:tRNA (guanine-N(1)-)-methyltransferase n=2 Tax=Candidatus Woykeibacteriota TaxID=1817899 RepID=A0A1G1W3I4_9BACT|nr:MAG: tRNA (guanosine(37)-N1)-methyltransferase TrmD [Candidatus Woykebacteria bacterium GWA1_44_8]OGY24466.1 MAG: tRNA (guanosine(37)-N1)-methyltransferase TrmD [Candidatus Woykebacteria bacterium GWB1_45_5]
MRFDILTLFPDFFKGPLSSSLLGKAIEKKIVEIYLHDIRECGVGKHKQVDDRPFGGGPGMVLKPDVLKQSLEKVTRSAKKKEAKKPHVVLLDPAGQPFNQQKAKDLAKKQWLILICGHYEGVDERFKELFVDSEVSIGDYILSGGETAALVVTETISRLVPGFLGKQESVISESFSKVKLGGKEVALLDYPAFTRPENFLNRRVPKVLLSGNHQQIEKWRLEKAIEKTRKRRPDLLREQITVSRKR